MKKRTFNNARKTNSTRRTPEKNTMGAPARKTNSNPRTPEKNTMGAPALMHALNTVGINLPMELVRNIAKTAENHRGAPNNQKALHNQAKKKATENRLARLRATPRRLF